MQQKTSRDARLHEALYRIISYFLTPLRDGGRGYRKSDLVRETSVSRTELDRLLRRERGIPGDGTKDGLAIALGQPPESFRVNLEAFADGLIEFSDLAPEVAALFPEPFESVQTKTTAAVLKLLPLLPEPDLAFISAEASQILARAHEVRGLDTVAARTLAALGEEIFMETFGFQPEQVEDIKAGRIPEKLTRRQAVTLFADRPIVDPDTLPD